MKKIFLLSIIISLLASCGQKKENILKDYSLTGSIDSISEGWVYLKKREKGKFLTVDSSALQDGSFAFTGQIGLPEMHYIQIPGEKYYIPFFLESSDISLKITASDLNKTIIEGSGSNTEYEKFLSAEEMITSEIRNLYTRLREAEGNESLEKKLEETLYALYDDKEALAYQYILNNNTSPVAPYIAVKNLYNYDIEQLNVILDSLDESLNNSVYTVILNERLEVLNRVAVGQPYIPVSLPDTNGNIISLAGLSEGKYLLVDFWASWCSPCRKENPNLVENYRKYNDQGFDILGISLDNNGDKWKNAIIEDNLTWHHMSDLKGWQSEAAGLYGIIAIPSNILLDPEGIIIARDLREEDLGNKLKELFE